MPFEKSKMVKSIFSISFNVGISDQNTTCFELTLFYNNAKTITCPLYIKSDYGDICILKSKISLPNLPLIHV